MLNSIRPRPNAGVLNKAQKLSDILPSFILGGSGWSYQVHPNPDKDLVLSIVKGAFDMGVHAIDTSPYYEPSEQLLGDALSQAEFVAKYPRQDYILMTKVGRIAATKFDYSPEGIRQSVRRSMERLKTDYLDVVFCHDIEYVTNEEAAEAIGILLEFVQQGKIRFVGASGYRIDLLIELAHQVMSRYGRPLDVIQNWGQMTLQNMRLETEGLDAFKAAGIQCVCNSSPLALGLLRSADVPRGAKGDFHPAPTDLKDVVRTAARYVASQEEDLAALALRYAIRRGYLASSPHFRVCTISGVSSPVELSKNIIVARQVAQEFSDVLKVEHSQASNRSLFQKDAVLCDKVKEILGPWMNYSFRSPEIGWDIHLKCMHQVKP